MKVNLGKTKVMVSGFKGEIIKSKIDPCGMCGKKVTAGSFLRCFKAGVLKLLVLWSP